MPEGDTLHRIAAALQVIVARTVRELSLPRQGLGASVRGDVVTEVRAVGKNLLVFFSGGLVLHTHLKMTGAWHVYAPHERWRRPARVVVAIIDVGSADASTHVAVCFQAPLVRLIERRRAERELVAPLERVDLIAAACDLDEVLRRLRTLPGATPIGVAVLDQEHVGGVGNVYKSEGLFRAGLSPTAPVAAITDAQLRALLVDLQQLMRDNVAQRVGTSTSVDGGAVEAYSYTRTTTGGPARPEGSPTRPISPLGTIGPLAVYGRAGQPCPTCSTAIRMVRQGPQQRSTYFCPRCQPPLAQG